MGQKRGRAEDRNMHTDPLPSTPCHPTAHWEIGAGPSAMHRFTWRLLGPLSAEPTPRVDLREEPCHAIPRIRHRGVVTRPATLLSSSE